MSTPSYRPQHGVAMVEFTIVLPVLLLLLFGVTEMGRAIVRYNTLTKAVQDGARYAAAWAPLGTTGGVQVNAQLRTEVRNVVIYGNTIGAGPPVLAGLLPEQIDVVEEGVDQIRVDVSYPYQPIFGSALPNFRLGSSISTTFLMQASVSMRAL